jgi:hypothetical protein
VRPRAIAIVLISTALVAGAAVAVAGLGKISTGEALHNLNKWKRQAHEPRVQGMKKSLSHGCALHNRYMKKNSPPGGILLTHYETQGAPGYTAAGARAGQHSVLATGETKPQPTWDDAVYHRLAVLQPRLHISGFSASHGYTCMNVQDGVSDAPSARTNKVKVYPWPPNKAKHVPTSFTDTEFPAPSQDAGGDKTLGVLLSGNVNGPWDSWIDPKTNVKKASLHDSHGRKVKIAISDAGAKNGAYLSGGFGLFPHKPLKHHRRYHAEARGIVKDQSGGVSPMPFHIKWSFKTG